MAFSAMLNKIPPPFWSSFPAHHTARNSGSSQTHYIMGNRSSKAQKRDSTPPPAYQESSSSSQGNVWSPPAYTSQNTNQSRISNSTTLADTESRYAFLKDFDTIFLVDDSSSMNGPRWREAEAAIAAIAPICTRYDADGIDIFFLNHRRPHTDDGMGAYSNVTTAQDVQRIFHNVRPRGSTPVGKRLLEILGPYLDRLESADSRRRRGRSIANGDVVCGVKPINIITITDGEFTDDAECVLVQVARQLDQHDRHLPPWQVGVQFFQIGTDEHVRQYLQHLDDNLGHDRYLRDMVDTVPWRGQTGQTLDAEGILKCLLGAVSRKWDRKQV